MNEPRLKVLIIEDQPINRSILKGILSKDYEPLEAANGKEGLKRLAENPDTAAILLDIVMPVMDGYAFLKALARSSYSSIPTIAVTSSSEAGTEQAILAIGAWDYVTKPYEPLTLLTRLKNVIQRSQFYLLNQMKRLYEYDSLTGIYNRSFFFVKTRELLDAHRDQTFALLHFDINYFQVYNAFWGEDGGDKLLVFLANFFTKEATRYSDCTYGRINADVFCLCIPYDPKDVQRLINAVDQALVAFNPEYRVSAAWGIYVIEDYGQGVDRMFDSVCLAAKECKRRPQTSYVYYEKSFSDKARNDQWVVNESRRALEEGEFVAFFQPQYDLKTLKPAGAEALVRWNHPEKGWISPGDFVPVLEKNGLIGAVDHHVWELVCAHLRDWIDRGYEPFPISVNVSRADVYNPELVSSLKALIKKYNIPANLLKLEITESLYVQNPKIMEQTVSALHEAGFRVLMDDFGSGYSSLNALKDIAFDVLKIDMNFLVNESQEKKSRTILASVIQMASALEIPVVMEGVETKSQVEFLQRLHCDYAQGYYFSKPVPAELYETLLQKKA